jgi:hypothetical protein
MGTPLTGSSVASTYTGLLKNTDNSTVSATLKAISDGSGNDSALQISSVAVNTTNDFSVATNKLTVAAATGNTLIAGTLGVTGATSLSSLATSGAATIGGALNVTGAITLTGNLTVPGNLAVTGTSNLTGNATLTGDLAANGNTTLGNAGTDTLTLNSDNITVPNLTPVVVDFTSDKMLITDASDSSKVKVVAGTYFAPQVKQTLYKDSTATGSPFVATSAGSGTEITVLTTSITPRSTSSQVLVNVAVNYTAKGDGVYGAFRITRNGTEIGSNNVGTSLYGIAPYFGLADLNNNGLSSQFIQILDSPSTTSAVTYKIHLYATGLSVLPSMWINKTTADINNGGNNSAAARVSSSMTLQEYFA